MNNLLPEVKKTIRLNGGEKIERRRDCVYLLRVTNFGFGNIPLEELIKQWGTDSAQISKLLETELYCGGYFKDIRTPFNGKIPDSPSGNNLGFDLLYTEDDELVENLHGKNHGKNGKSYLVGPEYHNIVKRYVDRGDTTLGVGDVKCFSHRGASFAPSSEVGGSRGGKKAEQRIRKTGKKQTNLEVAIDKWNDFGLEIILIDTIEFPEVRIRFCDPFVLQKDSMLNNPAGESDGLKIPNSRANHSKIDRRSYIFDGYNGIQNGFWN
jgi:hypothetical protein